MILCFIEVKSFLIILANYATNVIQSEDINKLNQIKKNYQIEIQEKDLTIEEREKRFKGRDDKKYEIELKINEMGFLVYKNILGKFYVKNREIQAGQKKKIYKIRKNKIAENVVEKINDDIYSKIVMFSGCFIMLTYVLYKKRKFK
jgi:hypothetical protein